MAITIINSKEEHVFDNRQKITEAKKIAEKNEETVTSKENTETENKTDDLEDNSLSYFDKEIDENDETDDLEDDEEKEEPKKENKGFQKKINKLTKEKYELFDRLQELEKKIEEKEKVTEQKTEILEEKIEDLEEPDIGDYEVYADYIKAHTKYSFKLEKLEEQKKALEEKKINETKKIVEAYNKKIEEAKKIYGEENWNNLKKINVEISPSIREELLTNEYGPHIVYYLYNNLDEVKVLNNKSLKDQLKAIMLIEEKIKSKLEKKSKVSNAPEPIKPLNGNKNTFDNSNKPYRTFKEYKAWREKNKK